MIHKLVEMQETLGVIQIPYADGMADSAGTVSYVNSAMIMTEDKAKDGSFKKIPKFFNGAR